MRQRIFNRRRSPLVHYGVLTVLVIILFVLGARLGTLLIQTVQQSPTANEAAAPASGGAALVQPPTRIEDFTLTSKTGQPLSLSDLRGQPVLLFFGYTHCPDECPLTMANFTQVKRALGNAGNGVHFLFVSVDGERDTPPVLTEFLGRFDASFIGMTGDPDSLRRLGAQFGLMFENVVLGTDGSNQPASADDENYFVNHISPAFLIDKDGFLTHLFFYGTKPDVIASNLQQVLDVE